MVCVGGVDVRTVAEGCSGTTAQTLLCAVGVQTCRVELERNYCASSSATNKRTNNGVCFTFPAPKSRMSDCATNDEFVVNADRGVPRR